MCSENFTALPQFYPWDTPQYWDTLYLQHLCETYTDKNLFGEPSQPLKESSRENLLTPQLLRELYIEHLMEQLLDGIRHLGTLNESIDTRTNP